MKIRPNTLWKVPVFCAVSGVVTSWLTILIGGRIFVVETVGADGIPVISIDPLRSALFHGILFVAVLLLGGLWAFRSMKKAELAVSAAIASGIYLVLVLGQLYFPGFFAQFTMVLAYIQNWVSTPGAIFTTLTGNGGFGVPTSVFTPFLFVFFGRKK